MRGSMCGIAGFSRSAESDLDPQAAARVLIASVAERGADAAGAAWMNADGSINVHKQPGGASKLLDELTIPSQLDTLLMHVRDHTKGRPSLPANNHPIRHGRVVGVHNGRIENDEAVFAALGRDRAEEGMTVDSEAIFASVDHDESSSVALERLQGSIATGWFDERDPGTVTLARGYGRPLWIAEVWGGQGSTILWASTLEALEIAREFLNIKVFARPVRPGTILRISHGVVIESTRFAPDKSAEWLLNPVASPAERDLCLRRLGVAM